MQAVGKDSTDRFGAFCNGALLQTGPRGQSCSGRNLRSKTGMGILGFPRPDEHEDAAFCLDRPKTLGGIPEAAVCRILMLIHHVLSSTYQIPCSLDRILMLT